MQNGHMSHIVYETNHFMGQIIFGCLATREQCEQIDLHIIWPLGNIQSDRTEGNKTETNDLILYEVESGWALNGFIWSLS